jgi:hypothetical protein
MKKLAIALMMVGVLLAGLGVAWPYQSSAQENCLRSRAKAVALLDEAIQAKGTPREQELAAEAEGESFFADAECERADGFRTQGYMILGSGLLLLVVGFVLSRKKPAA